MKWIPLGLGLSALIGIGACSAPNPGGNICLQGETLCGTECVNTQQNAFHCGVCENLCPGGQYCSAGTCGTECGAGEQACGASCTNPLTDPRHCGTCDNMCPSGVCVDGLCSSSGNTGGGPGAGGGAGVGGSPGASGGAGAAPGAGGTPGGTGGSGNPSSDPPGWARFGELAGCAWTGVDDTGVGTTIAPQDFLTRPAADPYCAAGSVGAHPDYESVALLGFNVNEDPATADCSYDPNAAQSEGPPGKMLGGTGIAANIVKQGSDTAFTFRVQIQGQDGATNANARWCATITATQGKIFVPYEDFNTECWDETSGVPYAGEPISAVVFLVPGEPTAVPYDFCVNGFATGDSAADAPDGPAVGTESGTVGTNISPDGDFDRQKVTVDGIEYIIQNNNWGNPEGTDLILDYNNNSFTISSGNGSTQGGGVPASFPSIYIGANGDTAGGTRQTTTDGLPKQMSTIGSIPSTFAWSGSTGSFNTTYDIWFANNPPTERYNDGIDGFVMVWVHKPGDAQPIGSVQGSYNNGGTNYDVWVGPRGEGPDGYNNATVVSFVAQGDVHSGNLDLKDFITEAGNYGMNAPYLTDVFFGFEIWNGGAGGGLSVDEWTCQIN